MTPHPQYEYERILARDVMPGDLITNSRNREPHRVVSIGTIGERARYIEFKHGHRIRPQHHKKFWRVVEPQATRDLYAEEASDPDAGPADLRRMFPL